MLAVEPPVIFAANHQSHIDTPLILCALPPRWRYRVAPAMYQEYFNMYYHPRGQPLGQLLLNSLEYYLVTALFNAFPLPQEGPGARETLRYAGDLVSDGWSILIFPEGERRTSGDMGEFHAGVGLLASRLKLPVIPIRLEGTDRVLPRGRTVPRIGSTRVSFGDALCLCGEKPEVAAKLVERAVKAL
jgi:long-chain acyl-CoA synthetase